MDTTITLSSPSVQRVGHSTNKFFIELATGAIYQYECPPELASKLHNTIMGVSIANQESDKHEVYDVVQQMQREFPEPTRLEEWPTLCEDAVET